MSNEPRSVDISAETTLLELAREVQRSGRPCRLRAGDEEIATLTPVRNGPKLADPDDIWAGYDPEKARQAMHALAGIFTHEQAEQLKADNRAQRGHDSDDRAE